MTRAEILEPLRRTSLTTSFGHVKSVSNLIIEASGPSAMLGDLCSIAADDGTQLVAEVVSIDEARVLLSPFSSQTPVRIGARVSKSRLRRQACVGNSFAGRLVDALGNPLDAAGPIAGWQQTSLEGAVPAPLERSGTGAALTTGIRALDGLLPLGVGQRVGIFAASGVGKTSLVEQLATQSSADRVVLCLVGERGREVESLWSRLGDRSDLNRFTMVAATSDQSAPLRARSVPYALSLAEFWRDQGENVLMIVDSVTRLAMALREIGLAAGSPPTARGYTPNIFSIIPRLVERCGALRSGGAISTIMTVLSETDDVDDPIVEMMKSLLDGHIVLSRSLAEQGHFPAIDVPRSVSRGIHQRISNEHRKAIEQASSALSAYEESRVLIETGVYRTGTNASVDRAIALRNRLMDYLRQREDTKVDRAEAVADLIQLCRSDAK